jgi:membrane-associated phospholipid phosphatase
LQANRLSMMFQKIFIALFITFLYGPQSILAQQDSVPKPIKPYIVPAVLVAGGLVTQGAISRQVQTSVLKKYPNFQTNVDDFVLYVPAAVTLGLGAFGVKGKNSFKDQIILLGLSQIVSQGTTQSMKYIIAYPRPDGNGHESFPSGHTTEAFMTATFLANEYGHKNILIPIAAYGMATSVAAMRMLQNRHWLADVLVGAGIGIGTTELVYQVYPKIKQKFSKKNKNAATIAPFYDGQAAGIYWVKTL